MKLSILICTVVGRETKFKLLYDHLKKQIIPGVEVLFEKDNKEISVGAKRQKLLDRAKGKFIVYIDDDDWVPDYYIKSLYDTITTNKDIDCIGFKIHCDISGKQESAAASNKYDTWRDNHDGYRYVRTIYHKTPVLREHALKIGFPDKRFAEDADYSFRLKASQLLKKESFIDKIMYYYRYTFEDNKTKYGIR